MIITETLILNAHASLELLRYLVFEMQRMYKH